MNQMGSADDLEPSGTKPSPKPMMTKLIYTYMHHQASMS